MNKVRKVIISVAGFGTRFLLVIKAQLEEMLPIVNESVDRYVVGGS